MRRCIHGKAERRHRMYQPNCMLILVTIHVDSVFIPQPVSAGARVVMSHDIRKIANCPSLQISSTRPQKVSKQANSDDVAEMHGFSARFLRAEKGDDISSSFCHACADMSDSTARRKRSTKWRKIAHTFGRLATTRLHNHVGILIKRCSQCRYCTRVRS